MADGGAGLGNRIVLPPRRRPRRRGDRGPWVDVHLCCNRAENGAWAGRLFALEVGRGDVRVHGLLDEANAPRLARAEDRTTVTFRRRAYPVSGWATWYGNWCWDLVRMRLADARALLTAAYRAGFTTEEYAEESPFVDIVLAAEAWHEASRKERARRNLAAMCATTPAPTSATERQTHLFPPGGPNGPV